MKAIQRIPTTQYGYIELELEYETSEEAVLDHDRLQSMYMGGAGLNVHEWKKVRETMLSVGECDPNIMDKMNKAQRWWINEAKLALRALKAEEPVIN